jgi:hypothetical protein
MELKASAFMQGLILFTAYFPVILFITYYQKLNRWFFWEWCWRKKSANILKRRVSAFLNIFADFTNRCIWINLISLFSNNVCSNLTWIFRIDEFNRVSGFKFWFRFYKKSRSRSLISLFPTSPHLTEARSVAKNPKNGSFFSILLQSYLQDRYKKLSLQDDLQKISANFTSTFVLFHVSTKSKLRVRQHQYLGAMRMDCKLCNEFQLHTLVPSFNGFYSLCIIIYDGLEQFQKL